VLAFLLPSLQGKAIVLAYPSAKQTSNQIILDISISPPPKTAAPMFNRAVQPFLKQSLIILAGIDSNGQGPTPQDQSIEHEPLSSP